MNAEDLRSRLPSTDNAKDHAPALKGRWKSTLPLLAALLLGALIAVAVTEKFSVQPLVAANSELRRKVKSFSDELHEKNTKLAGTAPVTQTAEQLVPSCMEADVNGHVAPGAKCDAGNEVRAEVCAAIPSNASLESVTNYSDSPLAYFIWDQFERWTESRREVCWRFENTDSHPAVAKLIVEYSVK